MGKKFGFTASAMVSAVLGFTLLGTLLVAPVAVALPQCITTAPNTTQCTTGGSNQIVTSPPLISSNNYGWPVFGGLGPNIVIGR
ncbi:hypothetical protein [Mycolicibacterium komossense]|nr:hypothetical protein [Mycolicibacterium komossense]